MAIRTRGKMTLWDKGFVDDDIIKEVELRDSSTVVNTQSISFDDASSSDGSPYIETSSAVEFDVSKDETADNIVLIGGSGTDGYEDEILWEIELNETYEFDYDGKFVIDTLRLEIPKDIENLAITTQGGIILFNSGFTDKIPKFQFDFDDGDGNTETKTESFDIDGTELQLERTTDGEAKCVVSEVFQSETEGRDWTVNVVSLIFDGEVEGEEDPFIWNFNVDKDFKYPSKVTVEKLEMEIE